MVAVVVVVSLVVLTLLFLVLKRVFRKDSQQTNTREIVPPVRLDKQTGEEVLPKIKNINECKPNAVADTWDAWDKLNQAQLKKGCEQFMAIEARCREDHENLLGIQAQGFVVNEAPQDEAPQNKAPQIEAPRNDTPQNEAQANIKDKDETEKFIEETEQTIKELEVTGEKRWNEFLQGYSERRSAEWRQDKQNQMIARYNKYKFDPTTFRSTKKGEKYTFLPAPMMDTVRDQLQNGDIAKVFANPDEIFQSDRTELEDLQAVFERESDTKYFATFGSDEKLDALQSNFQLWKQSGYKKDYRDDKLAITHGSMFTVGDAPRKIYISLPYQDLLLRANINKRRAFLKSLGQLGDLELSKLRWKLVATGFESPQGDSPSKTYFQFLSASEREGITNLRKNPNQPLEDRIGDGFREYVSDTQYPHPLMDLVQVGETEVETIKRFMPMLALNKCLVSDELQLDPSRRKQDVKFSLLNKQTIETWKSNDCPIDTQGQLLSSTDGVLRVVRNDDGANKSVRLIIKHGYFGDKLICTTDGKMNKDVLFD